jgi:DNA-binding XRE family transcriptional regulator
MPNIGALLKQEITRLARREVRSQVQPAKKSSAQVRRHVAALRLQVQALERQVALLKRRAGQGTPAAREPAHKMRFVAKGLKSQRARLGLSAADFGRLIGVSAQSVYNWEQGHAVPRAEQLASIAARRGLGKREALRILDELRPAKAARARKR